MRRVCVYCGSSPGAASTFIESAERLGEALAAQGLDLVYGGANKGLMGALADRVLASGGNVTGIIPHDLVDKEIAHNGLSELRVVDSMHQRKAAMLEFADALIALPGGTGTLEELIEAITWAQLGFHRKPVGLLNVSGYYDALLEFLDHAVSQEFLKPIHRRLLLVDDDPNELILKLRAFRPKHADKWHD